MTATATTTTATALSSITGTTDTQPDITDSTFTTSSANTASGTTATTEGSATVLEYLTTEAFSTPRPLTATASTQSDATAEITSQDDVAISASVTDTGPTMFFQSSTVAQTTDITTFTSAPPSPTGVSIVQEGSTVAPTSFSNLPAEAGGSSDTTTPTPPDTPPLMTTTGETYTSYSGFTDAGTGVDSYVSISDPGTKSGDPTFPPDSADSSITETDNTDQISTTTISAAAAAATPTGTTTLEAIPEITTSDASAKTGEGPSTVLGPTDQPGNALFTAGTDAPSPDVPTDTPVNNPTPNALPSDIPGSGEPPAEVPMEVPLPTMLAPDIALPDVPMEIPSPDLSLPDQAPEGFDTPSLTFTTPPGQAPADVGLSVVPSPDVPPPDTPPPEVPTNGPRTDEALPDVPPSDVSSLDVVTLSVPDEPLPGTQASDVTFSIVSPPAVPSPEPTEPTPTILSPDAPSSNVPLPDVSSETSTPRTLDTLIDKPLPNGIQTDAPVDSVLPLPKPEGAAPSTNLESPDPSGELAPVDFTFPFAEKPRPVESGSDSSLLLASGPGNISDRSPEPGDTVESSIGTSAVDSNPKQQESVTQGYPKPDSEGGESRPDPPKDVGNQPEDISKAQNPKETNGEESTSKGPEIQPDTGDQKNPEPEREQTGTQ